MIDLRLGPTPIPFPPRKRGPRMAFEKIPACAGMTERVNKVHPW